MGCVVVRGMLLSLKGRKGRHSVYRNVLAQEGVKRRSTGMRYSGGGQRQSPVAETVVEKAVFLRVLDSLVPCHPTADVLRKVERERARMRLCSLAMRIRKGRWVGGMENVEEKCRMAMDARRVLRERDSVT